MYNLFKLEFPIVDSPPFLFTMRREETKWNYQSFIQPNLKLIFVIVAIRKRTHQWGQYIDEVHDFLPCCVGSNLLNTSLAISFYFLPPKQFRLSRSPSFKSQVWEISGYNREHNIERTHVPWDAILRCISISNIPLFQKEIGNIARIQGSCLMNL